jgi:hypothetical protein
MNQRGDGLTRRGSLRYLSLLDNSSSNGFQKVWARFRGGSFDQLARRSLGVRLQRQTVEFLRRSHAYPPLFACAYGWVVRAVEV